MTVFPTLKPGDTIGIMAPASRTDRVRIDEAVKILEGMGYKVKVHAQTHLGFHSSAGQPADKVKAFEDLWGDPDVKAIMAARGGNESGEMLPTLDYKKLGSTPKILIGYSDITALLLAINKHADIVTFHGPVLNSLRNMDQGHLTQCFRMLSGHEKNIDISSSHILQSGTAQGRLIGGNLSVLCSLMGTPYQPDFKGALLFIEDIGDELSRINRFFLQLKLAGVFNQISGLIVGDFSNLSDEGSLKFERSVMDMLKHHTQGTSFPIVTEAPFGHQDSLMTLPVGASAELTAAQKPTLRLV